jgi:hypothetical protein
VTRKTRLPIVAALALVALLLTTAVAIAAKPKPGQYQDKKGNRLVASFTVHKGKVKNFSAFPKCAPVPVPLSAIKVKKGKFFFKGMVEDATGKRVSVEISGEFTTPTKAKGSYRYTTSSCTDSKKSFAAKRAA